MRKERALAPGVAWVLSNGELGFQQVLETFPSASRIAVLTYNFAKEDGTLVKLLRRLPDETRLDIVSNIPNVYPTYFNAKCVKRARESVDKARSLLNPNKFTTRTSIRFNLSNHAKIIATDLCAYVGSANFSDESADSFELGLVTTSPEAIESVFAYFDEVASGSIPDPGVEVEAVLALRDCRAELGEARDLVYESLFREADHDHDYITRSGGGEYYAPGHVPGAALQAIEQALDVLSMLVDDVQEKLATRGIELPSIDESLVERARQMLDPRGKLGRLLHFNSVDYANHVLQKSKEAYDEDLDRYAEAATQAAEDERERLADETQLAAEELLAVLDALGATLKGMANSLDDAIRQVENIRP